jgi:esterase/lipase superfamily enzyme
MTHPERTIQRLLYLGDEGAAELALIRERLGREGTPRRFETIAAGVERGSDLRALIFEGDPTVIQAGPAARPLLGALAAALAERLVRPECVVLHDCGSPGLVDEILRFVEFTIWVDHRLAGEPALRFLAAFYCGVGMGLDYGAAWELGRVEVDPAAPPGPELLRLAWRSDASRVGAYEVAVPDKATHVNSGPSVGVGPPQGTRPVPTPLPATRRRSFEVWYGTDRAPLLDAGGKLIGYSAARDNTLHLGRCEVEIPTAHAFGSIGSSWLRRFFMQVDDRVLLDDVAELEEAAYWDAIRQALGRRRADERAALVFIHGFRVSFESAARQAAQIGFDLKVPGVMAFYSWPSQGRLLDYLADEATIRVSIPYIQSFLESFATRSGASRIDILAHSMGNRGLVEALSRLAAGPAGSGRAEIGQVFHAAPDIDADEFRRLAGAYARHTRRTTLYASPEDVAVGASRFLHRFDRAGFTPPVTVVPGVDTVEVLDIDPTLLGHGYFAEAEALLYDIGDLLRRDADLGDRVHIERADEDGAAYWRLGMVTARRVAANVRRAAPALLAVGAVATVAGSRWGPVVGVLGLVAWLVALLAPTLTARLVPRPLRSIVGTPWLPAAAWLGALGATFWMLRPIMRRLFAIVLAVAALSAVALGGARDGDRNAAALAKVDPARIEATVRRLAAFPTRHTLSPSNLEAAAWLRDEFRKLGYEDVGFHDFTLGKATCRNVVCTKPGADREQFMIICAHLDSRGADLGAPESRAPGADDDASGVAALLELARVLKDVETPWSVRFAAFSGEEQGLVGSSAYATMAKDEKMKIKLVLNLDMVGHPIDPKRPAIVVERDAGNARRDNDAASAAVADRIEALAAGAGLRVKRGNIYASDYMPFEQLGFACVGLFDGADDRPFYHSRDDTPDQVDIRYCASATRLALATLLDLAADDRP